MGCDQEIDIRRRPQTRIGIDYLAYVGTLDGSIDNSCLAEPSVNLGERRFLRKVSCGDAAAVVPQGLQQLAVHACSRLAAFKNLAPDWRKLMPAKKVRECLGSQRLHGM